MPGMKTVRIKQELADQVQKTLGKSEYKNLSDFVSEAIELRLKALADKRTLDYLGQSRVIGTRLYKCINKYIHNIAVVKYDDSSIWVMCPMFGWFEDASLEGPLKLGCKDRKKHCTWFIG